MNKETIFNIIFRVFSLEELRELEGIVKLEAGRAVLRIHATRSGKWLAVWVEGSEMIHFTWAEVAQYTVPSILRVDYAELLKKPAKAAGTLLWASLSELVEEAYLLHTRRYGKEVSYVTAIASLCEAAGVAAHNKKVSEDALVMFLNKFVGLNPQAKRVILSLHSEDNNL